jgi:hypothetical protein
MKLPSDHKKRASGHSQTQAGAVEHILKGSHERAMDGSFD